MSLSVEREHIMHISFCIIFIPCTRVCIFFLSHHLFYFVLPFPFQPSSSYVSDMNTSDNTKVDVTTSFLIGRDLCAFFSTYFYSVSALLFSSVLISVARIYNNMQQTTALSIPSTTTTTEVAAAAAKKIRKKGRKETTLGERFLFRCFLFRHLPMGYRIWWPHKVLITSNISYWFFAVKCIELVFRSIYFVWTCSIVHRHILSCHWYSLRLVNKLWLFSVCAHYSNTHER